jgi:hypothetical protein
VDRCVSNPCKRGDACCLLNDDPAACRANTACQSQVFCRPRVNECGPLGANQTACAAKPYCT